MKKVLSIILITCLVFTMVACQNGEEKELTKVEKIKKKGKLVIGTSAAYPPYEFHKEIDGKDTIVGFDIDIAKEIANDLGVELEIKDMQFAGLLAALNAKKIDIVIAGMTPTEDRKKSVDFSKVYYTAKQGVVVSKEKADEIKTKNDLNDKKIGVQKGTTQEKIAKENFKEAKIVGLGKISDIMLQVMQKKIDAVIAEKPVAESYAKKNDSIVLSDIALNTGDSGSAVAIKKGNESLVKAVNETLDKLKENGKIAEFVTKATEMNN